MFNSMSKLFPFDQGKKIRVKGSVKNSRGIKKKSANKKRQAQRNNIEPAFEINWNMKWMKVLLAVALIAAIPFMLPGGQWLPIEKIQLSGSFKQLDSKIFEHQLKAFLGKGFFSVDIQAVQQLVNQQPWVRSVSVRRIWPNQLHVAVVEKVAIARWDEGHLLSRQAVIFEADSRVFKQLPLINGYSGQTRALLQRYSQIQQRFAVHGMGITEMREDSKGSLSLLMNNQLRISLGSENNDMKIKRFLAVYPLQIKPRAEHIKHIDFRYSNGYAIAWKKEYLKKLDSRGNKNV